MTIITRLRAVFLAVVSISVSAPLMALELPVPAPIVVTADARIPIEVSRVDVRAEITGRVSRTRVEFELFNPNVRQLEGELQFPLAPGQVVTGFALDIDGELRPAVSVEKAKGRQVFEDVTRARVDPALLESTVGNNYKLRIYPLPAKGKRRVVLEIAETLARTVTSEGGTNTLYRLPLAFPGSVSQLDAVVRIGGVGSERVAATLGAAKLDARAAGKTDSEVAFSRMNYEGNSFLAIEVSVPKATSFTTAGEYRGENYFYAELPAPHEGPGARPRPSSIGILWDASGTGAERNRAREFELLNNYFSALASKPVKVELVVVRDVAEPVKQFTIAKGDWRALRDYLKEQAFDGSTNLGQMKVPDGVDIALLFTDGLGNYGSDALPESAVPLYTINSSLRMNSTFLQAVAERSGAAFLDLTRLDPQRASTELQTVRVRLADLQASAADDLLAASRYPENGYIQIAGRLTSPQTELTLEWVDAKGGVTRQKVKLDPQVERDDAESMPLSAWRWASLKLQRLEQAPKRNRAAVLRLAKRFGLVSGLTSLIVLDTVEDYVRYEIEPPKTLLSHYRELLAQETERRNRLKSERLDILVQRFKERVEWWQKEFPKDTPPAVKRQKSVGMARLRSRVAQGIANEAPAPVQAEEEPMPMVDSLATAQASSGESKAKKPGESSAVIQLKKWEPDAPYIRRMKGASDDELYAVYLDEKPSYAQSTAFFLDVAGMMLDRDQQALGLRVLSNLAEMDLEDRHILRILAYRLIQAKRVDLALPLLERVRLLAPDEPQSWRDLSLALDAAGEDQQAIEHLWEVVTGDWDVRFTDIELTALTELNGIVARMRAEGKKPDLSSMDLRLLRNLPLDLRVVLGWDADNTDIDLWVIDPNGEKAFYSHPLTYQGGRMSRDFTVGYGPETFELHKAKPGRYTVKAQFYGHSQQVIAPATTLMLKLSTDFGTEVQKDKSVILRLSGAKDEVTVGTFEIK